MHSKEMKGDRGLIGLIVVLVIALILAKYFLNWSVFDAAASARGQATQSYLAQISSMIWNFVSTPIIAIWTKLISPILHGIWNVL